MFHLWLNKTTYYYGHVPKKHITMEYNVKIGEKVKKKEGAVNEWCLNITRNRRVHWDVTKGTEYELHVKSLFFFYCFLGSVLNVKSHHFRIHFDFFTSLSLHFPFSLLLVLSSTVFLGLALYSSSMLLLLFLKNQFTYIV